EMTTEVTHGIVYYRSDTDRSETWYGLHWKTMTTDNHRSETWYDLQQLR
ncbi:hypothetical protein RRG08_018767, partial [Elysia crispata]